MFQQWLVLPLPGFEAKEGWNANHSLHGLSCELSEVSGAVGITSAGWICLFISHLVCQHLNWLLLLKLAQRITSSLVFILPLHVPPCTRITLGSDPKEIQGTVCLFVPVLKANLKAGPSAQTSRACPDTAHQPILYAQGCREPPLGSRLRSGRNEAVLTNGSVHLGINVRQDPASKRLLEAPDGEISVCSAVWTSFKLRWLWNPTDFVNQWSSHWALWSQCPGSGPRGTASSQKHSMDLFFNSFNLWLFVVVVCSSTTLYHVLFGGFLFIYFFFVMSCFKYCCYPWYSSHRFYCRFILWPVVH